MLPREHLLTFSARSRESLRARLVQFDRWLRTAGSTAELADIAYTLNFGRSHFDSRYGTAAARGPTIDRGDLLQKLATFTQAGRAADCFATQEHTPLPSSAARQHFAHIQEELAARPVEQRFRVDILRQLAQSYTEGHDIRWAEIYRDCACRRLSLPGYAFGRQRYWLPPLSEQTTAASSIPANARRSDIEPAPIHYLQCVSGTCCFQIQRIGRVASYAGHDLVLDSKGDHAAAFAGHALQTGGASHRIIQVQAGLSFAHPAADHYTVAPDSAADYEALLRDLEERAAFPSAILIFDWPGTAIGDAGIGTIESRQVAQSCGMINQRLRGYFYLAQALARRVQKRISARS